MLPMPRRGIQQHESQVSRPDDGGRRMLAEGEDTE